MDLTCARILALCSVCAHVRVSSLPGCYLFDVWSEALPIGMSSLMDQSGLCLGVCFASAPFQCPCHLHEAWSSVESTPSPDEVWFWTLLATRFPLMWLGSNTHLHRGTFKGTHTVNNKTVMDALRVSVSQILRIYFYTHTREYLRLLAISSHRNNVILDMEWNHVLPYPISCLWYWCAIGGVNTTSNRHRSLLSLVLTNTVCLAHLFHHRNRN